MAINYPVAFVLFLALAFLFISFWPVFAGANWQPTSMNRVRSMLKMANANKDDYVYDLGFGDGRIIFMAIEEFHAKAGGVEIEPIKFIAAKIYAKWKGLEPDLKLGSAYGADFSRATIVTIFLSSFAHKLLKKKLAGLKKGTRIVTYYWKFPDWKPVKVDKKLELYLYEVGKL
ncbi:MAG: SAM-dependent methyltransferase [Candidatus Aenigmarchaeota archaeon]|nr:SAM-dependent methyltransferase [Candidatus Aenigmarchaeota archaeon]